MVVPMLVPVVIFAELVAQVAPIPAADVVQAAIPIGHAARERVRAHRAELGWPRDEGPGGDRGALVERCRTERERVGLSAQAGTDEERVWRFECRRMPVDPVAARSRAAEHRTGSCLRAAKRESCRDQWAENPLHGIP